MNSVAPPPAMPTAFSGGGDFTSLAALGKMAFALLVIIGAILLCAWLLRRLGPAGLGNAAGQQLKIVAAKALGAKEKVVIVEVDGTWLVLGVTTGGISKLHELPAAQTPPTLYQDDSFAKRFSAALRHRDRTGKRT